MNPVPARVTRMIDAAGLSAGVGLITVLIFVAMLPLLHRKGDAELRRQDLARQTARAAAARESLTAIEAQIAHERAALAGHPVRLESARAINHRLARLNTLAAARGMNLDGIEPGNVTRGTRYQTIDLKLTGTGRFRDCVRFLHDIHDQIPDMSVTALRLTGNPQSNASALSFDLQVRWFAAPAQITAATK